MHAVCTYIQIQVLLSVHRLHFITHEHQHGREDQATGQTPARKAYVFAHALPTPMTDDEILSSNSSLSSPHCPMMETSVDSSLEEGDSSLLSSDSASPTLPSSTETVAKKQMPRDDAVSNGENRENRLNAAKRVSSSASVPTKRKRAIASSAAKETQTRRTSRRTATTRSVRG